MVTVRSRAQARNRPRPRLAWLILAIFAGLIALSVRLAAADGITSDPSSQHIGIGAATDDVLERIESGELDAREIDELLVETLDELSDDQLEELGFDAEAIEHGFDAEPIGHAAFAGEAFASGPVRSHSPIGRVDLALVYRHVDPIASERRDELLLVGTWRR